MHAADLRHRDVGLVDDAKEVLREVVDEGVGRLARRAAVQMPRVVLDAGAKSHGLQHLQVVVHAHLQALGLQELPLFLELHEALAQLVLNRAESLVHLRPRRNVVGRGPDGQRLVAIQHLARDLVNLVDGLDLVPPELDADGMVGVGREHVQRVAPHAEGAALLLVVVAVVLDVDELMDDLVAIHLLLLVDEHRHARVVHGAADAVDAAHRCHHDDVPPRQQSRGGRMAQLLHLLVDGGVLLDEGVGGGHVGLGLVVVVVADEVHHGVVGEELLQLGRQLGRQRLVRRHDERGLLHRLDGLCHGEGLARAGDAQKRLVAQALSHPLRERGDGLGLVPRGLEGRDHLERGVRQPHLRQLPRHFHTFYIGKMSGHAHPSSHSNSL